MDRGGCAIGIEIGGTKLQVGIGRSDAQLLSLVRRTVNPAGGAEGIREQIVPLVTEALKEGRLSPGDLRSAGVGFGGPIDARSGCALESFQIGGWSQFPIRDWLRDRLDLPVAVQNDASTAAYAEAMFGAGRGMRRVFYMTIGSGCGGGYVVDGRIDEGQGLGATEMGHTWVPNPDGPGAVELESVASGWGIGRRAREAVKRGEKTMLKPDATAQDVHAAAEAGDALALHLLDQTTELLAMAMANVVALLHPERIVVGGGVSLMGPLFWNPLRAKVAKYGFRPFAGRYEVVPAALGESVVVIGAVLLAQGLAQSA
jgi:glucokinase